MSALPPTEDWRYFSRTPLQGGARGFVCCGYATDNDAMQAVSAYFGIQYGSTFPTDPYMFVKMGGVNAKRMDGPTTWLVTIEYVYLTFALGLQNPPLQQPTRWQFRWGTISKEIDTDRYGNLIASSTGNPFQPKRPKEFRSLFIQARKWMPNYSLQSTLMYMDKVNSVPVVVKTLGTVPVGCIKCNSFGPTQEIILSQPTPLEILVEFELRGQVVTGSALDPGFKLVELDQATSGWYTDPAGVRTPGDFTEPTQNAGGGVTYERRSVPTLLNGFGLPSDPTVRVGGDGGRTPHEPPAAPATGYTLAPTVTRQTTGKITRLLFDVDDQVDFGPLFALL